MRIGVSVFRRIVPSGSHSVAQGLLTLPQEATTRFGAMRADVTGTLVTGLSLVPAGPQSRRAAPLMQAPTDRRVVRLWLRTDWIGGETPERMKAFTEIDVEARDGGMTLPPLPLAGFAWVPQDSRPARNNARDHARRLARAELLRDDPAARPIPRRQAIARPSAPMTRPALIDLGDLWSAVEFVNEAIATGLVEKIETAPGAPLRLALKVTGG